MKIQTQRELDVTKDKLRWLEERFESIRNETTGDELARKLTLRTFKRLINQLTEEITWFECRAKSR